jgi:nitrogen regulatory protein PII
MNGRSIELCDRVESRKVTKTDMKMKEIKAYVRPDCLEQLIQALQEAGAPGITVVEVHPVGYGFEPNYFSQAREMIRRYYAIVKIELVCDDELVEPLVGTILDIASTGLKGDGRIFVSPVEEAFRIRDRGRGAGIL